MGKIFARPNISAYLIFGKKSERKREKKREKGSDKWKPKRINNNNIT